MRRLAPCVTAIGHDDDRGDRLGGIVGLDLVERSSQITATVLGPHGGQLQRLECFPKAPELDPEGIAKRRADTVANQRHGRLDAAPAVHIGDSHAA